MLFEIAWLGTGLELVEEAEYGSRKGYLEKQDFIAKQKEQLAAQQSKLDELALKVRIWRPCGRCFGCATMFKAVVVTDVVRTETPGKKICG